MGIGHLIYIPLCIVVGLALGWVLGGRGASGEIVSLQARLDQAEQQAARGRIARAEAGKEQDHDDS